jgi:hypothetical protein
MSEPTPTYDVGDEVYLRCEFHDNETVGAPLADPTAAHIKITKPDRTVITADYPGTIVKEATGRYLFRQLISDPDDFGIWAVVWSGTGALPGAEPYRFAVRRP